MSNFWTISLFWGLVFLFIAIALVFVLSPLLRREANPRAVDRQAANLAIYRDQLAELKADLDSGVLEDAQYDVAQRELLARLSEEVPQDGDAATAARADRRPAFAVGLMIPVLAIALYMTLGNPEALLERGARPPAAAVPGEHDPAAMIASLEAKLQANPEDAAGWFMLARSYATLGRFAESASALAQVVERVPPDPRLLTDYADVLAMAQGRNLQGKPLELVRQALELDPNNEKALNLAASAAYQRQDFAEAARYWRRLLQQLPPGSEAAAGIAAMVKQAESAAGPASGQGAQAPADIATISGTVTLRPELLARVSPTDTVFIFAQAANGGRRPLAIERIEASRLPYRFTLSDAASMAGDRLSNHADLVISARVSKSGQAAAQSGDLQGRIGPVKLGQQDVAIVIDSVLP